MILKLAILKRKFNYETGALKMVLPTFKSFRKVQQNLDTESKGFVWKLFVISAFERSEDFANSIVSFCKAIIDKKA